MSKSSLYKRVEREKQPISFAVHFYLSPLLLWREGVELVEEEQGE